MLVNSKKHIFARKLDFYFSTLKLETLQTFCELGLKRYFFRLKTEAFFKIYGSGCLLKCKLLFLLITK